MANIAYNIEIYIDQHLDQILLYIFLIVGLIIIFHNMYLISKGRQTNSWIKVQGKILRLKIGILKDSTETDYEAMYRPEIEYSYIIDEKSYESNKIYFGDKLYKSGKRRSERIIEQFAIGQIVDVYVNPINYEESVLIKGVKKHRFANIAVGFITIICGVLIEKNIDLIISFFENQQH